MQSHHHGQVPVYGQQFFLDQASIMSPTWTTIWVVWYQILFLVNAEILSNSHTQKWYMCTRPVHYLTFHCLSWESWIIYIYMLLPTDKRTLVLAGIPELLLWTIFLCIPLAVCLSEIIAFENEFYLSYRACVYCVSVLIMCILSKNLFLEFLLKSLVIQHCLWLLWLLQPSSLWKTKDNWFTSMHWITVLSHIVHVYMLPTRVLRAKIIHGGTSLGGVHNSVVHVLAT